MAELLVLVLRQRRERHGGDAFIPQRLGFFDTRLAIDAACLGLAIMHFARFLREGRADMLGIGLEMGSQVLEEGVSLPALASGRRFGRLGSAAPDRRGHRRLAHPGAAACGTDDCAGLDLDVIIAARAEPGFEAMAFVASERVADHDASFRAGAGELPAISTWNSRPCLIAGMRARASAEAARSISAKITPGSSPPSARTSPQGDTTRLWPWVLRPFSCRPPWAAASTKAPVSMARARTSTCQWASPVCRVKADGMAMKSAPAAASAR